MSYAQGRGNCNLLAVLCGQFADRERGEVNGQSSYPFPELVSSGRLEVHTLVNPTIDQFREAQKLVQPNILYLQGAQFENEDRIGSSIVWGTVDVSDPEMLSSLISLPLPTIVYFELPYGEKVAQAFRSKGVPYVIYWKGTFSYYAASHFRQALLSVVQSSCSHTWDAFQLAHASFRLYCARNNQLLKDSSQKFVAKLAPHLLGDAPKINIPIPEMDAIDEDNDPSEASSSITIFDEDVNINFLVCGVPCTLDACFLGSLEDGLNALLNIEIRGSKLRNRISATPPPLQAESFSRGFVTMRCDITTCSYAHISLLVSGSAQTCFDDQLLESQIKHELIEKSQLVHVLPCPDESKLYSFDPWNSASVACGTSVFQVCMKVPTWAAQVLKHLAPELSYRSLVTLGIASIQGTTVASFEKEDADRLLFFCKGQDKDTTVEVNAIPHPLKLFTSLTRERTSPLQPVQNGMIRKGDQNIKMEKPSKGGSPVSMYARKKLKVAALRPIPHSMRHKLMSFSVAPLSDINNANQVLPSLPVAPPMKYNVVPSAPVAHRKSNSSTLRAQPTIPLNPLPMKKHGCDRPPIQFCSEEEFLKDVMEFLMHRGHTRLVPQGGISEFPDAVLNSKRLDLYNLYKEVVSRGGFYVGNGINWKGQVFSKMRNHTVTNRMTGVGNTLKRHYETYLLEYELAHDDVDGECCLLCRSSAPGDWVNCGTCGEWAHFGCDRRLGLGTFKDYAKTDGLEYICPHCSVSNPKKKPQNMGNGFSIQ